MPPPKDNKPPEKPTPNNFNGFEPGDEKTAANYRYSPADAQGSIRDNLLGLKPGTSMKQAGLAPPGYIAPEPDPKAAAKARADHNDNVLDPFLGNPPGTTNKALNNVPDINLPSIPKGAASDAVRNQQPELTPRNLSQQIQPNAADLAQPAPSTAPNPELDRITKLSGITPKTPEAPKPEAPKPEEPKPEEPKPEAPKSANTERQPPSDAVRNQQPELTPRNLSQQIQPNAADLAQPAPSTAPNPEEPKPEAPKPEEPKPEAPKPEEPKPDTTDNDPENESSELDKLLEQYKEFKFIY